VVYTKETKLTKRDLEKRFTGANGEYGAWGGMSEFWNYLVQSWYENVACTGKRKE
jgi:hypothetical protein